MYTDSCKSWGPFQVVSKRIRSARTEVNPKQARVNSGEFLGYAFAGRDGSPSRPFAVGDPKLIRFNGGLGEPALPNAEAYYPVSP
jgi:hypothetical protein